MTLVAYNKPLLNKLAWFSALSFLVLERFWALVTLEDWLCRPAEDQQRQASLVVGFQQVCILGETKAS